ncbi:MAG: methylenetetrahydrofolate--tRNA-(uracil(54)-C(5))-methyltransferase (FADH(2)-oxidizing) TrmFO [Acidobacteria bacterium]|nr:methylenetetrahydrofolate--tRNA-(uracil(54)-C(5))-methyltransferase (FADH(2)-oxidizing) TrmFO [Acidobacteriota bacterium]
MQKAFREPVIVIGGGLAGPEAAWRVARAGLRVRLYEMRPHKNTPAHQTSELSELVCSNSFKSEKPDTAPWLLKQELRRMGALSMQTAAQCRLPAGHALTVDRAVYSQKIAEAVAAEPLIELVREEFTELPSEPDQIVVVASGPLTSDALADSIGRLTGGDRLFFFDSISPIVDADSVDLTIAFRASRWDNSLDGTADYLNCPFDKPQYERFYQALLEAEQHHTHDWDNPNFFEGCLPIEEIARRGKDTLRFGPMKPAGLTDPRTGRWPYACVQLRQETARADSYNLVGFQNHLKYAEQKRILQLIPGLENAEFLRYGQIHRNTYINGPALLAPTLQLRSHPHILFAGQISGVEGYVESMSTGLMAGWNAARLAQGQDPLEWPRETAHGSLAAYICGADPKHYQPANITFDLLPALPPEEQGRGRKDRQARRARQCARGLAALESFLNAHAELAA